MARPVSRTEPVFSVSVAAQLAGMHAQTLRQYDRLGLVVASRTRGGGRRYSLADIDALQEVQRLSQEEGINLAGIAHIMQLEREVAKLKGDNDRLRELVKKLDGILTSRKAAENRIFAGTSDGSIVTLSRGERARGRATGQAIVVWRP